MTVPVSGADASSACVRPQGGRSSCTGTTRDHQHGLGGNQRFRRSSQQLVRRGRPASTRHAHAASSHRERLREDSRPSTSHTRAGEDETHQRLRRATAVPTRGPLGATAPGAGGRPRLDVRDRSAEQLMAASASALALRAASPQRATIEELCSQMFRRSTESRCGTQRGIQGKHANNPLFFNRVRAAPQ